MVKLNYILVKMSVLNYSILDIHHYTWDNIVYELHPKLIFFIQALYVLGLIGMVLFSNNIIKFLLNVELVLLANGLNFAFWSYLFHDPFGQIYALLLLGVAAAETVIGLALIVNSSQLYSSVNFLNINDLKG